MNQKKIPPLFMLLILTLSGGWMMNVYLSPPDFAAYYSHAHTIFHDIDLDFRNEYEHFGFEKHMFYVTPAGHLSNDWPMGTGMAWSPFFLCGLAIEKAGGGKGGLSSSCFAAVAVGILFFVGAGLYAAWHYLAKRMGAAMATCAVALGFIGTPLMFYTYYGSFMSHATGFAFVTLFLILWADTIQTRRSSHWLMLGLLGGLCALIRPQHVLCMSVFGVEAFMKTRRKGEKNSAGMTSSFWKSMVLVSAGFLIAMLPAMIFYWRIYGNPIHLPKLEEMHWFRPALRETLFSDYHGLFLWTPLVLPAIAGLFFHDQKEKIAAWGFITVLLLQIYVNSANEIWWGGGSFSNRRLAEYSFILMAGLATLFKDERRFRVWIVPAAVMALWTLLLVIAERCGNLTLAHYVPWKADFLKSVFGSLAGPWPASLRGDFGGVDIFGRICATVCLGLLFAGLLIITARKSIIHDCSIQAAGGLLIAVTLVVLITAAAALRTRPLSPDEADGYYRENRFLWGNYYEYGYYLVNKGRLPEALKAYENAVNLLPERPQPYRYIGTIYEASGDWDRAEHYYREALKISPDYTQARMLLEGLALRRLGIPDSPEEP